MKLNRKVRLLDYFFVMRPTLFFPVCAVFLAGYNANIIFDSKEDNYVSEIISGSRPVVGISSILFVNDHSRFTWR